MINVTGRTRVFGIFGDPIEHSLSPRMQNAAFKKSGLDALYVPFHVLPQGLAAAVAGLGSLSVGGVNVTLPHKQAILPLLDRVDADARLIGAVNTVVVRDNQLIGYNTDGLGFIHSLKEDLRFDPAGKEVLLFGAGGACRAAVVALLRAGIRGLTLVNRNLDRAAQLVERIAPHFPEQAIRVQGFKDPAFHERLSQADLIVNTTSVGLKGEELSFCPLQKIKTSASIYDMVYSIAETPFVCAAKQRGLAAVDGLGMLAGQGEEAFLLWFGMRPVKGLMKNCLVKLRETNS
ncbi:MAG: shikimate dehydrogenase [Geopsychrobacter sp.]|nr:shikimate dehydrogenase [Geopsychrobacter sp.]